MKREKSIHSPEYIKFIDFLISERKRLSLTQKDIALSLGVDQSEISRIENKDRRLDLLELKQILDVYQIHKNKSLKDSVINFFNLKE